MVAIVKYRSKTIEDSLSTMVDLFKEGHINYSMRVKDGWVELRAWKAIRLRKSSMSINFIAYCLKRRRKVQIQDPKIVNLKGNRPAVKGRSLFYHVAIRLIHDQSILFLFG
ncbi:MAG: hypothetical protein QW193_01980 [Nitrososphaerales archaeon]